MLAYKALMCVRGGSPRQRAVGSFAIRTVAASSEEGLWYTGRTLAQEWAHKNHAPVTSGPKLGDCQ